jgi:hypothetical protein
MLGKLYVSRVSRLMKNLASFVRSHAQRPIVNAVIFSETPDYSENFIRK